MYLTRKVTERLHNALLDILIVNFGVTDASIAEALRNGSRFVVVFENGIELHGKLFTGSQMSRFKHLPAWLHLQFDGDKATIQGLRLDQHRLNPHSFKWNWHPSGKDDAELFYMDRVIYNLVQNCGLKGLTIL